MNLRDRVEQTLAEVGDRFPLHADPVGGLWRTTARGSWTAGFWVGLLSLFGHPETPRWNARLECWSDADTVLQGMIFWYGRSDADLAVRAAKSLVSRFDAGTGLVPWGDAIGQDTGIRADGAAGVVPLLAWAGFHDVARSHLDQHLELHPLERWSRGRAWLLLAAADAVLWLGDDYRDRAETMADEWLESEDSSAEAIAAVAVVKLGRDVSPMLDRLAERHFVDGRLLGGRYEELVNHELVWGTFFFALALAMSEGRLSPHDL